MIRTTIISLSILLPLCAMAQEKEYATGLIEDYESLKRIPMKKELVTKGIEVLPTSYSLRQYCPRPGDQDGKATCAVWSSAYAAMTIMEAIRWGWTDQDVITNEAFSPFCVYAQTKFANDRNCNIGITLETALWHLKYKGAPKYRNYDTPCDNLVPRWVADEAGEHLFDYAKLFENQFPPELDVEGKVKNRDKIIRLTKKAITEKKPVIISMHYPRGRRESLFMAGEVWMGGIIKAGEADFCYHALCAVGYDDNKAGGAFLIMNSWGELWGKDGFTWVKYDDFAYYVDCACELYADTQGTPLVVKPQPKPEPQHESEPQPQPQPQPEPQPEYSPGIIIDNVTEKTLAGSITFKLENDETMEMMRTETRPLAVYRCLGKYANHSAFGIELNSKTPAYVYVIGVDQENVVDSVFPPPYAKVGRPISPALTFSSNTIALPDEKHTYTINDSQKNYLCVLYARHALPMDRIMDYLKQHDGNIEDRLARAIDTLCEGERVEPKEIVCERDRLEFKSSTTRGIIPFVIEVRLFKRHL